MDSFEARAQTKSTCDLRVSHPGRLTMTRTRGIGSFAAIGGFVDLSGLYYLQGNNNVNPGTPSSNAGQNGNLNSLPLNGPIIVPGLPPQPPSANHSRGNGVFTFSPQQTRSNVETRTPTAW